MAHDVKLFFCPVNLHGWCVIRRLSGMRSTRISLISAQPHPTSSWQLLSQQNTHRKSSDSTTKPKWHWSSTSKEPISSSAIWKTKLRSSQGSASPFLQWLRRVRKISSGSGDLTRKDGAGFSLKVKRFPSSNFLKTKDGASLLLEVAQYFRSGIREGEMEGALSLKVTRYFRRGDPKRRDGTRLYLKMRCFQGVGKGR